MTALIGMKPMLWIAIGVAVVAFVWMLWSTGGW